MHSIHTLFKLFMLGILLLSQAHAITATSSSISNEGTARKAIDGNTDGDYNHGSVTHTSEKTPYEWLLIDLEKEKAITAITLWNRTDCCQNRLQNVVVMASNTAFSPASTEEGLKVAIAQSNWHDSIPNDTSNLRKKIFSFPVKKSRYILIQKAGSTLNKSNILSLAEVTVSEIHVDLEISKTAPKTAEFNTDITYNITIKNLDIDSAITAQKVIMTDQLPKNMAYRGTTAPSGWECTFSTGRITCTTDTMTPGSTATFEIRTTTPPDESNVTEIINTARVSSSSKEYNLTNNSASAKTQIITSSKDLSIQKVGPTVAVGSAQLFSYQIRVKNVGKGKATGFKVKDILDNTLQVSTAKGTNWNCPTAKTIICTYTANLREGETTPAITITVTAPSVKKNTNINNTATLELSDANKKNNSSTVTTTIKPGTTQETNNTLRKRLQFNIFGDSALIGNVNINKLPNVPPPPSGGDYNDNVDMHFTGFISTDGIYNKSSSKLKIPVQEGTNDKNQTVEIKGKIKWAGLYWEGNLHTKHKDMGIYESMKNHNDVPSALEGMKNIQFTIPLPQNTFKTVTVSANITHVKILRHAGGVDVGRKYNAFADVTNLLKENNASSGTYSVANIPLSEGKANDGCGGNYGGWALLVAYEYNTTGLTYDSKKIKFRNISIYNGFKSIENNNTTLKIVDFVTPLSGSIKASIAFIAGDGDPVTGGVIRMSTKKNTNTYTNIGGDSCNPLNNLLNSSICSLGKRINAQGPKKTYGFDADRVDVSKFMDYNQSIANFVLDNTAGNGKDNYTISMFSFITDLSIPIINDFNKTAALVKEDGTEIPLGKKDSEIYENSKIRYTLTFVNKGTETAEDIEIFDDFDFYNLGRAFNLNNFNASEIHLKKKGGNASKHTCGYDAINHKVWCKIDTMKKDDNYTMTFSVRIKNNLGDINASNEELNNTAYANYKNATTHEYVYLITDKNGKFGGKSKAFNAGKLISRVRHHEIVDAINDGFNYSSDKHITTKIANKKFTLQLVYLNDKNETVAYPKDNRTDGDYSMPVLLTLENNKTIHAKDTKELPAFTKGDSNTSAHNLIIPNASLEERIILHYINWGAILKGKEKKACTNKEDKAITKKGKFGGIPKCISTEEKLHKTFKKFTNFNVEDCLNDKRDFGCFHYLTELVSHDSNHSKLKFNNKSTDNFSIRPDHFKLNSKENHYPRLLRAGHDYNISITAIDGGNTTTTATQDYNTSADNLEVNITRYFKDGTLATKTQIVGDFNMTTNGEFKDGNLSDQKIQFSDVGILKLDIRDKNWTKVDRDDFNEEDLETLLDCNTTNPKKGVISIEASLAICTKPAADLRFIPHHFKVEPTLHNHRDGNFTYLANQTAQMAAHVGAAITAENEENNTTKNFDSASGYYEQNMTVEMNVTAWNSTIVSYLGRVSRHPDKNATIKDINKSEKLGTFIKGVSPVGGFSASEWNNTVVKKLYFNYGKNYTKVINPFAVPDSDVLITVRASYDDGNDTKDKNNTIESKGIGSTGNKVLFLYARVKSTRADDFYPNIPLNFSQKTPVQVLIYQYDKINPEKNTTVDIPNTEDGTTLHWRRHTDHNSSQGDGNITLRVNNALIAKLDSYSVTVATGVGGGIDNTINTDCKNQTGNAFIFLNLAKTAEWMDFNKTVYGIECESKSAWTGHGETGNVVNSDAYKRRTKKLSW